MPAWRRWPRASCTKRPSPRLAACSWTPRSAACWPRCAACRCWSSARPACDGWSQLLVYPDAFRVQRSHVDAAGVLHEWEDELIGEAWEAGPLILSWADVHGRLRRPDAGFCVATHEMAHKLDALDGAMDGTPPLPRAWQRQWAADFQRAFDALCRAGRRRTRDRHRCLRRRSARGILRGGHRVPLQRPGPAARDDARSGRAPASDFYGRSPFALQGRDS